MKLRRYRRRRKNPVRRRTRRNGNSAILNLLWNYMKRDPEHSDRVRTGWGTKTKKGLVASVERICNEIAIERT